MDNFKSSSKDVRNTIQFDFKINSISLHFGNFFDMFNIGHDNTYLQILKGLDFKK